jgi:micrococcal nuclease
MSKRTKRKILKMFIQIIFILLIAFVLSINDDSLEFKVKLESCVDGDTAKFVTDDGIETVRFLAIDTPETVHPTIEAEPFGKEASNFTCNKLTNANTIILELDNASDKYDKYDRLLAWVFVDGNLLQEELINMGYAKTAYLYGDYKYTNLLIKSEEKAKIEQRGLWYNNSR